MGFDIVVYLDKSLNGINRDILIGPTARRVADPRLLGPVRGFPNVGVLDGSGGCRRTCFAAPRRRGIKPHLIANSAGSAHYPCRTSNSPALFASPPNACLTRPSLASLAEPWCRISPT